MFKLPNRIPNSKSKAQDWADYAEFLALQKVSISLLSILKDPSLISDEIEIDGVEDETDKLNDKIDEVSDEIERRIIHMGKRYPFSLEKKGYVLIFDTKSNLYSLIYRYMLLATRIKMTGVTGSNRIINGIDGALIFEKLCGEIAVKFFGENTRMEVFGTSSPLGSGFSKKIDDIIKKLGEGGSARTYPGSRPQDDKVDIIVWKDFIDKRSSKFIGFGQCKTGTSWLDHLSELQPDIFCKTWFMDSPILEPIKMFFCAQYFPKDVWAYKARTAGLIFDRFRIIENLPDSIDAKLLSDIENWYKGAELKYINSTVPKP